MSLFHFVFAFGSTSRDGVTNGVKYGLSRVRPNMSLNGESYVLNIAIVRGDHVGSDSLRKLFPHSPLLGLHTTDVIAALSTESNSAHVEQTRSTLQVLMDGALMRRKEKFGIETKHVRSSNGTLRPCLRTLSTASDYAIPWVIAGDTWRLHTPLDLDTMFGPRMVPNVKYRLVGSNLRIRYKNGGDDASLGAINNTVRVLRAAGVRVQDEDETVDDNDRERGSLVNRAFEVESIVHMMGFRVEDIWGTAACRAYDHQNNTREKRCRGRPPPTFHPEKIDPGIGKFALPTMESLVFPLATAVAFDLQRVDENGVSEVVRVVDVTRCVGWNIDFKISRGVFSVMQSDDALFEFEMDLKLVWDNEIMRVHLDPYCNPPVPVDEDNLPVRRKVARVGPPPVTEAMKISTLVPFSTQASCLHPVCSFADSSVISYALVSRPTVRAEGALGVLPHYIDLSSSASMRLNSSSMFRIPNINAAIVADNMSVTFTPEDSVCSVRTFTSARGEFNIVKSAVSVPHEADEFGRRAISQLLIGGLKSAFHYQPTTEEDREFMISYIANMIDSFRIWKMSEDQIGIASSSSSICGPSLLEDNVIDIQSMLQSIKDAVALAGALAAADAATAGVLDGESTSTSSLKRSASEMS